jgi:2-polyprenyl-6-methoxyphenol hydroxylase-like FAD-dependent oxidoreductase
MPEAKPQPPSVTPVLVVGAGPTGLTLAAELARFGVSCRIIDKGTGPTQLSKAIGMQARTLEILDNLGIIDEILAAGHVVRGLSGHVNDRRIFHFTYDELDSPYPFLLNIVQSDTERILGGLVERQGLTVEWEVELLGFEQDDDGVTARLRHPDGTEEDVRTEWLLGCDGARSTIRGLLGTSFEGQTYSEYFALTDARLEWSLSDEELHAFVHPEGVLFTLPLGDGNYRLIVADKARDGHTDGVEPTFEDFQRVLEVRGPRNAVLSDPGWMTAFHVNARVVGEHRQGRVFVAGDAAHIHSPVGGQGLNTSVQDAHNLAWKLAHVIAGGADDSLLDSYEAERAPVAHSVIKMTNALTHMLTLHNVEAQRVRNVCMPLLGHVHAVGRHIAEQDSEVVVNYRHSPFVDEFRHGRFGIRRFAGGPHPGDRAPDVAQLGLPDGSEGRFFELLRGATWHTLLLFEGEGPNEVTAAELAELAASAEAEYGDALRTYVVSTASSGEGTISDRAGALHHRFHADEPCLYLVRPDGYIALRGRPPERDSLRGYLNRVTSPVVAAASS